MSTLRQQIEVDTTLYERDFHAWSQQQAALLRAGCWQQLDLVHLIEEIETLGRSEYRELVSRLEVLLMHLLKWQYQAERRSRSWEATLEEQRNRLDDHLQDNPSLRAKLPEAITRAYRNARLMAVRETQVPKTDFPEVCPYPIEMIFDRRFFPGN